MVKFETVRALAGSRCPGAEEGTSYGTPAFKVKGKLFVRLREDGALVVVLGGIGDREALIAEDPDTFYITPHYENSVRGARQPRPNRQEVHGGDPRGLVARPVAEEARRRVRRRRRQLGVRLVSTRDGAGVIKGDEIALSRHGHAHRCSPISKGRERPRAGSRGSRATTPSCWHRCRGRRSSWPSG